MSSPLPPNIAGYLRRYLRRRRFYAFIHSISLAIVVAVAWTLACCLIDRLFALSQTVRLILLTINIFLTITLAAYPLARWLFRRTNWNAVAAEIEQRDRRFEQLLQTLVSQHLSPPPQRGSAQLLDHLEVDLQLRLDNIRPSSLHSLRPLLFDITLAAAVIVIAGSLTQFAWLDLQRLLHRYTNPFARLSPATTTHLDITPGDADTIAGQSLTVRAQVTGQGDSPVTLHAMESSAIQHFTMAPTNGAFTFTFPSVDRDFRYYVTSGDATSTTYDVRALSRPALASCDIQYDYPPGLYKSSTTVTNSTGLLEAPAGTHAHLTLHLTEPLVHTQVFMQGRIIETTGDAESLLRHVDLLLEHEDTYEVRLLSHHNISNRTSSIPIHIVPDAAPSVRLLQPASDTTMSPWDSLTIAVGAEDDFGLAKVSVVVAAHGQQRELALPIAGHPLRAQSSINLDLSELNLGEGDAVTLTPVASDGTNHTTHGAAVSILIAHTSIDPAAKQRSAALVRAADDAQTLATALQHAKESFDTARKINPSEGLRASIARAEARRQLAAAAQTANEVRISLDRAIARSPTALLSIGLLSLIDDATYAAAALDTASRVLESTTTDTSWARAKVEQAASHAAQLRDATRTLSRAQIATLLASQTSDLARLPAAAATQPATAALVNQAVALATRLSINPADANARIGIISEAAKLLSQSKPVDFAAAADEFSGELPASGDRMPFLDERLEAAAQSEALRSDAELVRAADLALAARAANSAVHLAPGAQVDHFKQSFSNAMRALEREHEARRLAAPPADWDAIAAGAEAARQTLRELAGEAANDQEKTLTANAQLAARPPIPTTQVTPTPVPPVAVEAGKLEAQQEALREKPAPDSAKMQAAVAAEVEKLRRSREASRAGDHRAEMARDLAEAEDVAQKLSQQVSDLREAANRARDLGNRAQRAAQAAAKATPQSMEPAEELAADLANRAAAATKDLDAAKAAMTPGETQKISGALQKFSPGSPSQSLADNVAASMRAQVQSAGGDPAAESAEVTRAEQAAGNARGTVEHALNQLANEDPLAVASASSSAAAQSMQSGSPTAAVHQQRAANSLSRAREQIVHTAASEAVAKLPGVSAILSGSMPDMAGPQWRLSTAAAESHATATSSVAPDYQDAIRAYFQALANQK